MKVALKIAVVYPTSLPWMAEILDGIRRYSRPLGGWQILTCPPNLAASGEAPRTLRSLAGWQGDAAIAAIHSVDDREIARELGIPVVNISTWDARHHGLHRVSVDNQLAGCLAAEHLIDGGLRHFGYAGWCNVHYSDLRRIGFTRRLEEQGFPCAIRLDDPGSQHGVALVEQLRGLAAWLESLPRPCGVFAVHDYRAQLVIEACAAAGLRVPKDIAVLGMDNDAVICEHSMPTLSSVSRNSGQVGWEAAALIHRLLDGETDLPMEILVPPEGIAERQSTDRFHHNDEVVQLAVNFMLGNLKDTPNVEVVAQHVGVSKRTLEMRFKACTGKPPHRFLTAARVEHAVKLMKEPARRNVRAIAMDCGFSSYTAFVAAFRSVTGMTPGEHREASAAAKVAIEPDAGESRM